MAISVVPVPVTPKFPIPVMVCCITARECRHCTVLRSETPGGGGPYSRPYPKWTPEFFQDLLASTNGGRVVNLHLTMRGGGGPDAHGPSVLEAWEFGSGGTPHSLDSNEYPDITALEPYLGHLPAWLVIDVNAWDCTVRAGCGRYAPLLSASGGTEDSDGSGYGLPETHVSIFNRFDAPAVPVRSWDWGGPRRFIIRSRGAPTPPTRDGVDPWIHRLTRCYPLSCWLDKK